MSYIWCLKKSALREQRLLRNRKRDSLKLIVHKMHHILSNYLLVFSGVCFLSWWRNRKTAYAVGSYMCLSFKWWNYFILNKIYKNRKEISLSWNSAAANVFFLSSEERLCLGFFLILRSAFSFLIYSSSIRLPSLLSFLFCSQSCAA